MSLYICEKNKVHRVTIKKVCEKQFGLTVVTNNLINSIIIVII